MLNEEWKDIAGYEGIYQVSNTGRVRSLDRKIMHSDGKPYTVKGRILKLFTNRYKYLCADLSVDNKKLSARAHRLVAAAFIDNPYNLPCVNHKDENKANNTVDNLEWCTIQYNNTYGNYSRFGPERKAKKVSQFSKDGELIKTYVSQAEAQRSTGLSSSSIGVCCSGKRKTYGGYVWKYA
jgi:hypothetical protein